MAEKRNPKLALGMLRVRRCHRTFAEVAKLLGMRKVRVQQIEARALLKLRAHPVMQQLARDAGLLE